MNRAESAGHGHLGDDEAAARGEEVMSPEEVSDPEYAVETVRAARREGLISHPGYHEPDYPEEVAAGDADGMIYSDEEYPYDREEYDYVFED